MSNNFWQDKKVIVTGGSGFLGSFVVEKLKERGAEDVFVPRSSQYDLRNPDGIAEMLNAFDANMVIHLAALQAESVRTARVRLNSSTII